MSKNSELRVLALVLGSLLLCELTLWKLEPSLSGDVRHIQEMAEISARLSADTTGLTVLWLGNSITDDGVDLPLADSLIEDGLRHHASMYKVHPDGSAIAEWTQIASNQFFERGSRPDILVIPFAWNLLSDQSKVEAERIGRWYLRTPADWLEFLRFDAGGFEEGSRAIFANFSAAFGNRERVRTRVLAMLPGYEEMALGLSRGGGTDEQPAADANRLDSYDRLSRLALQAAADGTRLILVAMPVREPYELEAGLLETAADLGVGIIDARHVDGIDADQFRDQMHLLPAGARIVTRSVAGQLVSSGHLTRRPVPAGPTAYSAAHHPTRSN